ncbi:nucleotidyltransferase domain-containing protein [Candidatus Parcubacteria bacterium]|nr:nucleotidyltransferase domain-containing protein [Candidatus Parcubacteria bacterium]
MKLSIKQSQELKKIAKKYDLKLIMLFGSFANGTNRQESDFDLAVSAKKEIEFKNELKLISELSAVFKKNVDLSVMNKANPLLLEQVSKRAVLLCGAKSDFIKFKLYAFHRYNDYRPYFKMESEFVKKEIKQYAC